MKHFPLKRIAFTLVFAALVGAMGTLQASGFHPGVNASLATAGATVGSTTTNLLLPFVTNSGVASVSSLTTAQSTRFIIRFHNVLSTFNPAAASATTTDQANGRIGALSVNDATLFKTPGVATESIAATPGFQGYLMALCQFQNAQGFAFITVGFGSEPTIAEGYLALVVPRIGTGESLGH